MIRSCLHLPATYLVPSLSLIRASVTLKANDAYERSMARCLELAARGAGSVSPNPMVGCVIVAPNGTVLGEGWHEKFGGPHAEVRAVYEVVQRHGAGALQSSTMIVNLEPCSHQGKTPPCADLILANRIPRVVVGLTDPNLQVAGAGMRRLRDQGVEVVEGVLAERCARLNEAFLRHTVTGLPLVVLKIAQTLDGCVATAGGDSRWISGEESRRRVHEMRATLDAVLVGSGTARSDDPALTVRSTHGRQPRRIVLDRTGTLPASLKLFSDDHADRTMAVVGEGRRPPYADTLRSRGGTILEIEELDDLLDLRLVLEALGRGSGGVLPIQSVLVEAGPRLATVLVRNGLIDRMHLFVAPILIGVGKRAFGDLGVSRLKDAVSFTETRWEQVGADALFTGFVHAAADLVKVTL